MPSRLVPIHEVPDVPITDVVWCMGSAAWQVYLAQARRDKGMISDKELAVVERVAGPMAKQLVTIMNPFTGEKRKVEA